MKIDGYDELKRKLDRFVTKQGVLSVVAPALVTTGEEIRNVLSQYPSPPRYPLRWASQQQKFYVLRVLRKGVGPYRRTTDPMSQRLQASWVVSRHDLPHRVVVGTRVTYARYVQSARAQQPFHKDTGWTTDAQAVQYVFENDVLHKNIFDAVNKYLRGGT